MSTDLNKWIGVGRLCRDPELKYIPSGTAICNFSIAVNESWKQDDEWKKKTAFVDINVWGDRGILCSERLKKGDPVLIEGKLTFEQWEKDGQKRSKLSVTAEKTFFLEKKPEAQISPSVGDGEDDVPF